MKGVQIALLLITFASIGHAEFKSCRDVPSGAFIPNRANCNYFFLCVDGYLMQLECAPYIIFEPIDQICDKNCNVPITTPATTTSTKFPTAPVLTTTTPSSSTGGGGIPTAPTVGPPNTEDPCYNLPTGTYVGIPGSCSWFWYCRNGVGLMSQCPDGKCFDNDVKRCI